jgi:hypothetical protein
MPPLAEDLETEKSMLKKSPQEMEVEELEEMFYRQPTVTGPRPKTLQEIEEQKRIFKTIGISLLLLGMAIGFGYWKWFY